MSTRRTLDGLPPWTLAVTAMLAVQLSNALSVPVIGQVGPAGTAWLRMCFGVVFLWLLARPAIGSLRRQDIPALLALGVATGFMTTFFLAAVDRIPLGTAVAVEFLGPLTVAGVTSRRRSALVWPALAFCGVVLLSEPWRGSIDPAGLGFAVAAGTCWALYNVLTQHVGDRLSGISGLSLTIPVAAVATLPVGLPQVLGGELVWWVLPAAAGIALITPVLAFGLEMLALRRMTHTAFGTLLSVEPAFGVLIGLLVLGQAPAPVQVVGITVVVLAGIAAQRGGRRDARPRSSAPPAPTASGAA
ncbi:EamA family transporter [Kocuria tytonis]|uniref:EamA family transporter n=1 Tax=Kocuria tytonis TaxID=2054280 RepID=A0A495AAG0_9MICC|nr:EamA family transporter [Kocuria tytonis]RKQ36832.1 EamA family transporter [Kocuria tytonis]